MVYPNFINYGYGKKIFSLSFSGHSFHFYNKLSCLASWSPLSFLLIVPIISRKGKKKINPLNNIL